ncbi:MAG: prepilin-type N-terminal cleavage/methylation domain-containing protein [Coriobacteriia bacterium]|nr:prepilin-type N-terminal cleavage/methylation domain-containing protein [Coriobacteriia bacterium]
MRSTLDARATLGQDIFRTTSAIISACAHRVAVETRRTRSFLLGLMSGVIVIVGFRSTGRILHARLTAACSSDSGFSLIEIMVVLLIIAILLAIALAVYVPATAAANSAACKYNQRVLTDAISIARTSMGAEAVDELEDLRPYVKDFDNCCTCPETGELLKFNPDTGEVTCPEHQ